MEKKQENFKMLDLFKYTNGYNLGYRFSKYEKSERMKEVVSNIAKYNKEDSFAVGLLSGFEQGRKFPAKKNQRKTELDMIFEKDEQSRDSDKER